MGTLAKIDAEDNDRDFLTKDEAFYVINAIDQLTMAIQQAQNVPDGYASWKDAAIAERVRRVEDERKLKRLDADIQEPVAFMNNTDDETGVRIHRIITVKDFGGDKTNFLDWGQGNADEGWQPLYVK